MPGKNALVNEAIEIKYLAQGHKHTGCCGACRHNIDGLVIMSPALFRYTTHALKILENVWKHFLVII